MYAIRIAYIPFGVTAPLPTRFCAPLRKKATPREYILISLAERRAKTFTYTSFARLITQFFRCVVGFNRLRYNRAGGVTALVVGRLGRYDSGDVAAREACEDANE